MTYYVYLIAAFVFGFAASFLFKYLAKCTVLSVYEVSSDMVPIDREILEDIVNESNEGECGLRRGASDRRMRVRMDLGTIQVRLHRIIANAARSKYWARTDQRLIRKNRLEHPIEVSDGIKTVLDAEREVWQLCAWLLFRIWLWNLSGFQRRTWGPIPNIRNFDIAKVLATYEKLKQATVELARSSGEAGIAEELAVVM